MLLMTMERKQLPDALTEAKKKNCGTERMPVKIAWMQFMLAIRKIVNVQVAVACKELSFRLRNSGTKKRPPPSPKPLKIPEYIPISINYLLFYSKKSMRSNSYSPRVIVGAVQKSRDFLLNLQNQKATTNITNYKIQQPMEQPLSPIRLGNFYDPLIKIKETQTSTSRRSCLNILTLIQSSKGLILVDLIISLLRSFY